MTSSVTPRLRYPGQLWRAVRPLGVLERDLVEWLATCHPDDRLKMKTKELVENGLRQRRIPSAEWDERRMVKLVS